MDRTTVYLIAATLLPVVASIILYLIDKKTPFGNLNYWVKQLFFGIIFGGIAVLGTEYGITMANGAVVNARDAAVLAGGLMFGGPAGILAGLIGGVERWIAVAWGIGSYTRIACSVSTAFAGIYAALLRRYMFENKKPGVLLSFAIGIVMEVFHLTMVFITHMDSPDQAMSVIQSCTIPMLAANAISLMLTAFFLSLISKELFATSKNGRASITNTIQKWMLIAVAVAFGLTTLFVYRLQTEIATKDAENILNLSIDETINDLHDSADQNLIDIAKRVSDEPSKKDLSALSQKYGVAEIDLVNDQGVVFGSTNTEYIGFDITSENRSAEFLAILSGEKTSVAQGYGPSMFNSNSNRKYAGIKSESGLIIVGYDGEQYTNNVSSRAVGITKNRHIGGSGFVVIFNIDKKIVSAPDSIEVQTVEENYSKLQNIKFDTVFTSDFAGEEAYCLYKKSDNYRIVAVYPTSEALSTRNTAVYVNTFMEILVFAILFAIIYLLIKKSVVNQIKEFNTSLGNITEGDLGVVVNVRSSSEFSSLSDDINVTVDTLKHYIDDANQRIDKELEFAKSIQTSALPREFPARNDFEIYAKMNPAKEVGGDFYDFYLTENERRLNFLIADVSGKGIPAAMFMMRAKTELKTLTESDMNIDEVFTVGNAGLCEGNDAGMFVTAWQGGIDLETGLVDFANAGHNPPLVKHGDGKYEYLKSKVGFVLAGMDGVKYKAQDLELRRGDSIFLYTDGVTEATNANNELYGEERLLEAINDREFNSMKDLCTFVRKDVDKFVGNAPQFDDITMVALKYLGKPVVPFISFTAASLDDIPKVTEFVEAELEKMDCPMKTVIQINVAIDEIYSNIVRYGYPKEPGPVTVKVIEEKRPHRVSICFVDEGIPYNPLTKEDPDITLSAEERGVGGLGIFMVKKTMDEMRYMYENNSNVLTITKNLEEPKKPIVD